MCKHLLKILIFFCFIVIACCCINVPAYAQNRVIDSIQVLLEKTTAIDKKIPLLQDLALQYIYVKPAKTFEFAKEAYNISKSVNDKKSMCLSLNLEGFGYWGMGESQRAFDYYRQSLEMAQELNDEVLVARNYQSFANLYNQAGYYTKAISVLQKNVLPVLERNKVNERLPFAYNSIAYAYLYLKQYDSALKYLDIAIPLAKKYQPLLYPTIIFNKADIYFKQNRHYLSKQYLFQVKQLAGNSNDKRMIARSHQLLAEIDLLEGKIDSALINSNVAVKVAEEAGIKESVFPSYLSLAKVSEAKGDKDTAIFYLKVHMALKDSVKNREVAGNIHLYEFENQQNQIEVLKVEKKQSRYLLISSIIVGGLLCSFLFYMIRMHHKTEVSNHLLEQKNKEIEAQAKALSDMNEVKSKLFSIVAHDLRSPLASIIGILSLLEDDTISPEEIVPHLPALSQNVGETITMLDNLLQWSRSQLQGVTANPEMFNVNDIILSKLKLYEQEARRKGIVFNSLLQQNETVYADKNMIAIILQNLINNAVKFTDKGGTIKVNTEKNNGHNVTISISDTGKGIARDKIAKLVNGNGFTTQGTAQEKGLGLGFQICKEFVNLNRGKIDIESEENEGTTVKITLPDTIL